MEPFQHPSPHSCALWSLVAFLTRVLGLLLVQNFWRRPYWNGLASRPWKLQYVLEDWTNLLTPTPCYSNPPVALKGHGKDPRYFPQQRLACRQVHGTIQAVENHCSMQRMGGKQYLAGVGEINGPLSGGLGGVLAMRRSHMILKTSPQNNLSHLCNKGHTTRSHKH